MSNTKIVGPMGERELHVPSYNNFTGSKFDSNLSIVEIAKRVRADIKAAIKAGDLPAGLKVSVRAETFSGGCALRVCIMACPFNIMNIARVEFDMDHPHDYPETEEVRARYNERASEMQEALDSIVQAYNRDSSDIASDYFNVKFYDGHPTFCHELHQSHRDATKATILEMRQARATESYAPEFWQAWPSTV
jgi:hypothetical protein